MSSTPIKTLIVAPAWIGDMLMAQPLLQLLHEQQQQIDILAPSSTLAIAERMPQIHTSILMPLKHGELNLKQRYQLGKSLRNQYTQAIVLANTLKSALIPWWAKIPKRVGWLGEQRYFLLNDYRRLNKSRYPSLIERYAALGLPKDALRKDLSQPKLTVDADNLQHCLTTLNLSTDRPILGLCPGAEYGPTKRWPAQHYATVAQHFIDQGWQIWLLGTPQEKQAAELIQQQTNNACVNLCGKTSLLDAIDLLSLCQLVATNDSGLMHIAAAVGAPLVALYGSTSPSYTPPASDKATILQLDFPCSPCFKRQCPLEGSEHLRCLTQLTPERVINALTRQRQ